jgi:hypothetical protein
LLQPFVCFSHKKNSLADLAKKKTKTKGKKKKKKNGDERDVVAFPRRHSGGRVSAAPFCGLAIGVAGLQRVAPSVTVREIVATNRYGSIETWVDGEKVTARKLATLSAHEPTNSSHWWTILL